MGFLQIFKSWKGEGILPKTLDGFIGMIEDSHWMFLTATHTLWGEGWTQAIKDSIYERDVRVNKAERSNRKKIVEHLSVSPGVDTNYCLVLMSVMKDAERVGDYCKNLFEITQYHHTAKEDNEWVTRLKSLESRVNAMFGEVAVAFRNSDEEIGNQLVREEVSIAKECDGYIEGILKSEGLTVPQAVTYTLLARYYKRIAAHLGNIASSVVMPLHKLDYYDEKYLPGKEPSADED